MAKRNFKFNLDLGGLKDTLTDTISTVADKVLDLADAAADTAKVGQQIAKLYVEKKKEETALSEAYLELGKLYYEMYSEEAEGVLADLCAEITNTLINIEDITGEIETLKESVDADFEDLDDDDFETEDDAEEESYLDKVADTVEDALEGLEEAIEAALEKMEATTELPDIDPIDDDVEVTIEEYLDDDDFAAPAEDAEIEIEVIELEAPAEEEAVPPAAE